MIDNKLLRIFQVIILLIGIILLGKLAFDIIFFKLSIESKILRGFIGIIGLAIWIRFLVHIVREFKKII